MMMNQEMMMEKMLIRMKMVTLEKTLAIPMTQKPKMVNKTPKMETMLTKLSLIHYLKLKTRPRNWMKMIILFKKMDISQKTHNK